MTDLGFLGPENTYHDIARQRFLPTLSFSFFKNFDEIFDALKNGKIKKALIAVSNNASGLVSNNLERIQSEKFNIIQDFDLNINLCLASNKQLSLKEISKVYSHTMAIKETQHYFSKYSHITFISSTSTAGAIQELQNNREKTAAVIASKEAIQANNLLLLFENIEDHPENKTTFSLIER
ncbi:MAG: prephenate dehydratase [Roseivirga sp.]|jgi:prephenate dehydratase